MNSIQLGALGPQHIPAASDCSILNTPHTVYNRTLQNRIVFQPMEGADGTADGSPGELTFRRYRRFAASGAGIIWVEATAVCPEGRANPHQLYLSQENKQHFSKLVEEIKTIACAAHGWEPVVILQATHSGRQSRPVQEPQPICAYHNALLEQEKPLPAQARMIQDAECEALSERYYETTLLAAECGFDGIDVKCCHGYLLSEFLSARNRPGSYGGSLANRTRLYFSCLERAKQAARETGVFLTTRIGLYEGFVYPWGFGVSEENGLDFDFTEPVWVLEQLRSRFGIELVNLTIGNPYANPHVNRPYAGCSTEKPAEGVARIAVITRALQEAFPELTFLLSGPSALMEQSLSYCAGMLQSGAAQLAGFGRMTLAYPGFWNDYLKEGKIDRAKCCTTCGKCTSIMRSGGQAGCPVRDRDCYLPIYRRYVEGGDAL